MTSLALELIDRFTSEALAELAMVDARGKAATLASLEIARRKIEAVTAAVVADSDRSQSYRDDGHVSVRGWVKASVRTSDAEVSNAVRVARLCRELPACAEALAAGRLGVAQARELARVLNNPRCGVQLGEVIAVLLESAADDTHEVFVRVLREWESLVDSDGSHRDHESAHLARRARIAVVGETVYLDGQFGAAQGAAMAEILDRFNEAEFEDDLADLRSQEGDGVLPGLIERTEAQRRADAMAKIFERAAATTKSTTRPRRRVAKRWSDRPRQHRFALPPPQPVQVPGLPVLARPHRAVAHLPPRRHRDPRGLSAASLPPLSEHPRG